MVKKTTKHYVEYLGIGTVQNREERYIEEVKERTPKKIKVPGNCYAFRFFDRIVISMNGENYVGDRKNVSGCFYKSAEIINLEKLKKEQRGEYRSLISYMEDKHLELLVKTKFGKLIPLYGEDEVI